MSSEEEVDDFEINDYELASALGQVKRKKRSKKSQIYGIWNDEDSDDERPQFGQQRKGKKDYTAPVSFVAGGVKPASEFKKDEPPLSSEDDDSAPVLDPNDDTYEAEYLKNEPKKIKLEKDVKNEPENEPDESNKSSNIGKSETATGNLKIGGATKAKGGYSMSAICGKEKTDKGFAKFAGKGSFAERMMKKMGWKEGSGLGKFDQGIINPVTVKQRVKGSGMGAHGTERTKESLIHFPTEEVKQKYAAKQEKKAAKGPQWRATESASRKKKPNYLFKSVDDLKRSGGYGVESDDEDPVEELKPQMKIIDMTGKEQREITDMNQIPSQKAGSKKKRSSDGSSSDSSSESSEEELEKVWSCKELEHNLDTLVRNAKNDILKAERAYQEDDNRRHHYKYESTRNKKQIEADQNKISELEEVLELLADVYDVRELDDAFIIIAKLKHSFTNEWDEFYLEYEMADKIVRPKLTEKFNNWLPLRQPEQNLQEVARWRRVLPSFYDALLWECWLPPVRRAIMSWNPRKSGHILEFVSLWKSEVTTNIWDNIMIQLILPKLVHAVNSWDPYRDQTMVNEWLLPWHPILGKNRMYEMITTIRQQLRGCLKAWEASDHSAKTVLAPWQNIWSPAEWDQFMIQNIVPKLEESMRRVHINISTCNTKEVNWVQDWIGLVPIKSILRLFDEFFFVKWSSALRAWLSSPTCNLGDVAGWYRAWYSALHLEVKSSGTVRDNLSQCLQLMKRTCDERSKRMPQSAPPTIPPPPSPPSMVISDDEMETDENEIPTSDYRQKAPAEAIEGPPVNFKDLVERRAAQRNIIFMPKGKQFLGKEIYVLGKKNLYIEKGVCFVSDGAGDWVPTSITKLYDKA